VVVFSVFPCSHILVRYSPPLFLRTYYKAKQERCVLRPDNFVLV
jgi:hypothetical protein